MTTLGDVGAGNTLGRYELLTPIAQGGMAMVWAARLNGTRGFQKVFAVKTMLPSLSDDPQFEQMFLAEAELSARIRHPNVCEIMDLGEEHDTLYIVMEWVNGEPLTALLTVTRDKGGIPLSVVTKLARDAALGLHGAHEVRNDDGELLGLVHRDVSPQNILVGHDGIVKIVDFGIAKATAGLDAGRTQVGQMKGKVPYMAPEQARGESVDRRTDVFALGVVLYQLITSKHPFRGENDSTTLLRICEPVPAPVPSLLVPAVPASLDAVVARALEKDPARRFQTMAELAEALDRVRAQLAARGDDVEMSAFVRTFLGERAERRKRAIKEGIRVADERTRMKKERSLSVSVSIDIGDDLISGPSSMFNMPSALITGVGAAPISSRSPLAGPLAGSPDAIPDSRSSSPIADRSSSSQAGVSSNEVPARPPAGKRSSRLLLGLLAISAAIAAIVVVTRRVGSRQEPAPQTLAGSSAEPPAREAASAAQADAEPSAPASKGPSTAEETGVSREATEASSSLQPTPPQRRRRVQAPRGAATPSSPTTPVRTSGPKVRDPGF